MSLMYRITTVTTGYAGAPYYSNHFFDIAPGTPAQAHAAVTTFWLEAASAISSGSTMTVQSDVPTIDTTDGHIVSVASVPPQVVPGQLAPGTPLPASQQLLVQLRTGVYLGGRQLRGRLFIMGQTVAGMANGRPAAATITDLNAAAATLVANANAQWVVWSKLGGVAHPITSATTWNEYAVLRSRRS